MGVEEERALRVRAYSVVARSRVGRSRFCAPGPGQKSSSILVYYLFISNAEVVGVAC